MIAICRMHDPFMIAASKIKVLVKYQTSPDQNRNLGLSLYPHPGSYVQTHFISPNSGIERLASELCYLLRPMSPRLYASQDLQGASTSSSRQREPRLRCRRVRGLGF